MEENREVKGVGVWDGDDKSCVFHLHGTQHTQ